MLKSGRVNCIKYSKHVKWSLCASRYMKLLYMKTIQGWWVYIEQTNIYHLENNSYSWLKKSLLVQSIVSGSSRELKSIFSYMNEWGDSRHYLNSILTFWSLVLQLLSVSLICTMKDSMFFVGTYILHVCLVIYPEE